MDFSFALSGTMTMKSYFLFKTFTTKSSFGVSNLASWFQYTLQIKRIFSKEICALFVCFYVYLCDKAILGVGLQGHLEISR